jgi:hypothetical protein
VAPASAASSAVRSARYVPRLAAAVRARSQRAQCSLHAIDQNITSRVPNPPEPTSSIASSRGVQSPARARWAIHGIWAAPTGVRESAWSVPAAVAASMTVLPSRTVLRRSAAITSNASRRTRG